MTSAITFAMFVFLTVNTTMAQSRNGATGAATLDGTYWRAIELAGARVPAQDPQREAHLLFQPGGRLSGLDGCNRITGSYKLNADAVTFGQLAATQMACPDTGATERAFREALKSAAK